MVISVDYDDTWSADPSLWAQFAQAAREGGHTVVVTTNRSPNFPLNAVLERSCLPYVEAVIYADTLPKKQAAAQHGYEVDVWIDDTPSSVDYGLF